MKNRNIILNLFWLGCFALCQVAQAVVPPPDGGYPGGNTAEGQNALLSLNVSTGTFNTAVGWSSLRSNVEGQLNTAVGAGALLSNTGSGNTAIGVAALFSDTTGGDNTAVGLLALFQNTTGLENTANGAFALFSNTEGFGNTATGTSALNSNTTGGDNTANGTFALLHNTTGNSNTALGRDALFANITGNNNTAIGRSALGSNTAHFNTAIGFSALALNTTGANNTAIGTNALANNTTGSNNIALGAGAGSDIHTASDTICIGIAGVDVTDGCYIGHVFQEAIDADHLDMAIDVNGKVGTPASSRRFKEDVKPMDKASEAVLALKPVAFCYKNDKKRSPRFGLIAEEVAEVKPELVAFDNEGKPYSVRYDQVNAMLLNEFLKDHRRVQELEKGITALTAQLKEQAAQIENVSAEVELSTFAKGRTRKGGRPSQVAASNP